MAGSSDEAARARLAGNGGGDHNGELRKQEIALAPKVMVEQLAAAGHDNETGQLVSLCVATGTQGLVTLVLPMALVPQVIDGLAAALAGAYKVAEAHGKPPERLVFPIQSFAVGEMAGLKGVMLALNHGHPYERAYLTTNPQHAITMGQALIKQASRQAVIPPRKRKLILPPHS